MKCLFYIFTFCVIVQFIDGRDEVESFDDDMIAHERLDGGLRDSMELDEDQNPELSNDRGHKADGSDSEEAQALALPGDQGQNDDEVKKKVFQETMQQFAREMAAGDMADLVGSNQHIHQPKLYNDLGRRFVPQYKYTEVLQKVRVEPDDNELIPEEAPPELVLVVAKESALLKPEKMDDLGDDVDGKKILRSGEYWNGVWKEEVDPKSALRTGSQKKVLGSIKARIKSGTEFYKVVSRMKKISPRLLYIINKKKI